MSKVRNQRVSMAGAVLVFACTFSTWAAAFAEEPGKPEVLTGTTQLAGLVLLPDGNPAAGAEIFALTRRTFFNVENGKPRIPIRVRWEGPRSDDRPLQVPSRAVADAEGRFSIAVPDEEYSVAVFHDGGHLLFHHKNFPPEGKVVLAPWGGVKGRAMIGAKPAVNVEIQMTVQVAYSPDDGESLRWYQYRTTTDGDGNFAWDRVVAGEASLTNRGESRKWTYSGCSVGLWIEPGETARQDLGGIGRPVIGRIEMADGTSPCSGLSFMSSQLAMEPGPPPLMKRPPNWDKLSPEQQRPFIKAYQRTKAYRAWAHGRQTFGLAVAEDGSFRADDVPAGKYVLHLRGEFPSVEFPEGGVDPTEGKYLAQFDSKVSVPGGAVERSDEAFDLGPLRLVVEKEGASIKVGDKAPAFALPTLDRRGLRLDDFKGKVVLLAFWATWSAPCQIEMPFLKQIRETFGADDRFAMIGVNEDEYPGPAVKYAEQNGLNWPQAHLRRDDPLTSKYGAAGVPSIWLVDRNGIVCAKDLRGEEIKAAVEKALAANEKPK